MFSKSEVVHSADYMFSRPLGSLGFILSQFENRVTLKLLLVEWGIEGGNPLKISMLHMHINRLNSTKFDVFISLMCFLPLKNFPSDGWMTCDFTSFSTVFHSYQDDGQMILKGCVSRHWNPVYG